ncbi:MAG: UDP-N-acetylglucosamine 1-carboxyvinyltransferase, partial [Chloroflexota bacterium]|nr:UDP-N-acetylglucosamine 1-carboxyvinyltransferase [Chloroflexota bacterium]
GAALVLAGLAADGITTIRAAHHLRRGYERMIEKLVGIGAYTTYEVTDEAFAAAD